jgi:hypothetical protein
VINEGAMWPFKGGWKVFSGREIGYGSKES